MYTDIATYKTAITTYEAKKLIHRCILFTTVHDTVQVLPKYLNLMPHQELQQWMEWNNKMLEKQLQDNNPAKFLNDEKKIHKKYIIRGQM